MEQLIEVLPCDLQVTIHQGLAEVQVDIVKAIAGLINHFHIKVMILSAPQVHVLLDHMCARCSSSNSFLAAIRQGTTPARPESFMERGPNDLVQSLFDRLPDHQMNLDRGLTWPTDLGKKVDQTVRNLQTCMVDTTSDPTLMLNFKSEVHDITIIDLTGDEAVIRYPPLRGYITEDPQDDTNTSTARPSIQTIPRMPVMYHFPAPHLHTLDP